MTAVEFQRLSGMAERYVVALRTGVDLLVDILGPLGVTVVCGALFVIAFEWVRWLIS